MKKIIIIAALSLAASFASCGAGNDPVKIAEEFARAYYDADFDKCNKLMGEDAEFTPSGEMSAVEKAMVKAIREQSKQHGYKIAVDQESTSVTEGTARVWLFITAKANPDFEEDGRVVLWKADDGKWYVESYSLDRDM